MRAGAAYVRVVAVFERGPLHRFRDAVPRGCIPRPGTPSGFPITGDTWATGDWNRPDGDREREKPAVGHILSFIVD